MTLWQKTSRMLIMLAALAGFVMLFIVGQPLLERLGLFSDTLATIWAYGFVIGVMFGSVSFFWLLLRLLDPPEYRQAREYGLPAAAKVLDVRKTGARKVRRSGGGSYVVHRSIKLEYVFRLLVTCPGVEPYEATMVEYFDPDALKIPRRRSTIAVKVHPQRPQVVVYAPDALPAA